MMLPKYINININTNIHAKTKIDTFLFQTTVPIQMLTCARDVVEFPSPFASYSTDKIYGTICVSPQDRILLVLGRLSMLWSLPKGHRKYQESSFQCALRELYEETGITIDQTELNFSELPYKRLKIGRYYLLEFPDEVQPRPRDEKEIVSAQWFTSSEIYDLIHKKLANIDVRRLGKILEETDI